MNITSEILEAFAVSEKQKHENCMPGQCQHREQNDALCDMVMEACRGAATWRALVDRQIEITLKQCSKGEDTMSVLRAMSIFFVMLGLEIAESQEGARSLDKAFGAGVQ